MRTASPVGVSAVVNLSVSRPRATTALWRHPWLLHPRSVAGWPTRSAPDTWDLNEAQKGLKQRACRQGASPECSARCALTPPSRGPGAGPGACTVGVGVREPGF